MQPAQEIRCMSCDYNCRRLIYLVDLTYGLPGGRSVKAVGTCLGWCDECQDIRDVELPFDIQGVPERVAALQGKVRADRWKPGRVLGRLFGRTSRDEDELAELESLLLLAGFRKGAPRCLDCGEEGAIQLDFDSNTGISSFVHECGGRLQRLEPPENAIRILRRPISYQLDPEGRGI